MSSIRYPAVLATIALTVTIVGLSGCNDVTAPSSAAASEPTAAPAVHPPQERVAATADLLDQAREGDADAQFAVAQACESGGGMTQDFSEAAQWYVFAAEQDHLKAQQRLSDLLLTGKTNDSEYAETWSLLYPQAEACNRAAQLAVSILYAMGKGVDADQNAAIDWLEQAAESGLAVAQVNYGRYFERGDLGVPRNVATAFSWYTKAAEQTYPEGQNMLALCYDNGIGTRRDPAKAAEWFAKAAQQGHAHAQANLGTKYATGNGIERDFDNARKWCRLAAEQGHPDGANNLAHMYHQGLGVGQDMKVAVKWYTVAANNDHVQAQNVLGMLYATGQGVTRDYTEAQRWWTRAAAAGDMRAQYNLAGMYSRNLSTTLSYDDAVRWMRRAAEQGHPSAQVELQQLLDAGPTG
jgi:TPR repeat protein